MSLYQIERPNSYTDPVSNIFSFGGEQRNRGVEWSFFGSPLQDVRLMGGVAHVDPKITAGDHKGKTATGLPKLQGKLGVEWDTPLVHGLTLTANATSVSWQYIDTNNTQSIPGYTVYDLGQPLRHSGGQPCADLARQRDQRGQQGLLGYAAAVEPGPWCAAYR